MSIQWFVCDMDGTLLDSDGRISSENINAIQELKDAGVKVILATGRSHLHVKELLHRLEIEGPFISSNGGLIRGDGESVLYSKVIHCDASRNLAKYCLETRQDMLVYTYDYIHHSCLDGRVDIYHRYNEQVHDSFRIPLKAVRTLEDIPLEQIIKFFLWNIDLTAQPQLDDILKRGSYFSVTSSTKGALDIMSHGISKGDALSFLACHAGVDLTRTAVIGDNFNDVSMLRIANMPIAVANAEEEVKRYAKHISLSNNENGVAFAIRQWILPSLRLPRIALLGGKLC